MGGTVTELPQLNTSQLRTQGWNVTTPTLDDIMNNAAILKRGDAGDAVRDMQLRLMELGYDLGPAGADGKFGPITESALREFQGRNANLIATDGTFAPDDGRFGSATFAPLFGTVSDNEGNILAPAYGPLRSGDGDNFATERLTSAERQRIAAFSQWTDDMQCRIDPTLESAVATQRASVLARESRPNANAATQARSSRESGSSWIGGEATAFTFRRQPDAYFGTGHNATIRDYRGQVVTRNADVAAAGVEGELNVVGVGARLGSSNNVGVDGRLSADVSGRFGGYVARSWNSERGEGSISGAGGAYVGADASKEWNVGLRYFGFGARASVGVGAGGEASGYASNENRRLSVGGFARGGLGVTGGAGGQVWFDWGRVADDARWVGSRISDAWNSIGWGTAEGSTFR